jgi:ATP-binding cassette subfamily B protein
MRQQTYAGNGQKAELMPSAAIAHQILTDLCSHSTDVADLLSVLEFYPLELGEAWQSPHRATIPLPRESDSQVGLAFVCEGRMRVLGYDETLQREVSVQPLDPGMGWGCDCDVEPAALDYRVIAASSAVIAYLAPPTVQQLCQTDAKFAGWLQDGIRQRQALLFLKTQTALRSLPGRQLQSCLPDLLEVRVAAETAITTAIPDATHVWVRAGQIQPATGAKLEPGAEAGYPQPIPVDWRATQPLWLYVLPAAIWDTAIAPYLPSSPTPTHPPTPARVPPQSPLPVPVAQPLPPLGPPPVTTKLTHRESLPQPTPQPSNVIAFPSPKTWYRRRSWWRQYPFVEQQSSSDCGIACLSMIARYWGKHFPLHVLRENAEVSRSGTSLKSLTKVSEAFGLSARPVRASFQRLAEQPHPWIAHWQGDHFVVVYAMRQGRVLIADPAVGKRLIAQAEFEANWTNYALLLEPSDRFYATQAPKASLGRYIQTLHPYRSLMLQIVLVSLLIQTFGLVTPLLTQIILDRVVVQKSISSLHVFAIGLLLFGIWSTAIIGIRQYLLSYLSNRLDLTLISGFIQHTLTLPLKFFESRRVGDIITRVQENQKIQRFLVERVVIAFLDFVTGFVYLGLMLYYSPRLTLLVVTLIPLIMIFTLAATPLLQKVSREIFKEAAAQNSTLVETISGIAMIKSAAAESEMRWQWEDHLTGQMNAQFRGQKLGIRLEFVSGLINSVGSTALLWYGATLVIQGELTIGQLIAFNMMMGYIIHPVISMANLWDEFQEVLIAVERLNDVFAATPENSALVERMVLPPIRGDITLEDVTFRYGDDQERNTIQNLSLQILDGETIALVGTSGSGKTTLIKLLQGLYPLNRGKILIDGHDIRHVDMASLRSQIGVVPQECFLFSGTILENIRLYRQHIRLEDVIEVAKLAEAHSFIQGLPLSYNTKVGERGTTLSGGQRQRIAIARALLDNPRILLLDEATSALDVESERRFQRNLEQISRDRTTIIIAHRLSTVRHADRILVLDQGVLVEQGTHAELMQQQGLYFHLAQHQVAL